MGSMPSTTRSISVTVWNRRSGRSAAGTSPVRETTPATSTPASDEQRQVPVLMPNPADTRTGVPSR
jgi:hypothetical protein